MNEKSLNIPMAKLSLISHSNVMENVSACDEIIKQKESKISDEFLNNLNHPA